MIYYFTIKNRRLEKAGLKIEIHYLKNKQKNHTFTQNKTLVCY